MKKRSAVILVNWGEILEKKRSYLIGSFSKVYTLLSKERKSWFPDCRIRGDFAHDSEENISLLD